MRFTVVRQSREQLGRVTREASRALVAATASVGIASLVLSTGCYTYEVRSPADVPTSQHVVVTLNNRGRVALMPMVGDDAATLEGDMVSANAEGLRMRVDQTTYLAGTASSFGGSEVTVPTDGITVVSTKQFSRSKTVALVVLAAAAVFGAIRAFGLGGIGGSGNDNKPPNPPPAQ